ADDKPADAPVTVNEALMAYSTDLEARAASVENVSRVRYRMPAKLAALPVAMRRPEAGRGESGSRQSARSAARRAARPHCRAGQRHDVQACGGGVCPRPRLRAAGRRAGNHWNARLAGRASAV